MSAPPTPNFDRVARVYRWAEYMALGPLLQRTRVHFLPQLTACRRALVLGDGDGRFLVELLRQNPQLDALAVDTSAEMLRLLRDRCNAASRRLQTLQAPALAVEAAPLTDLVVTHFFLDCLTQSEVDALAQRLGSETARGTLWLVSDFALPESPVLSSIAALYIRGLYFAFGVLTGLGVTHLPDVEMALTDAGFSRVVRHQLCFGLLYTELWCNQKSTISG